MKRGVTGALGLVATVVLVAMAAVAAGRVAFDRRVEQEVAQLFARADNGQPSVVQEDELAGLPGPVQRWLRRAGVVGKERPVTVRLKMAGQFRTRPDGPWMPFEAAEYYTTDPPAFVWSATMQMSPLVSIVGRDTYADGHGHMEFRILSLIPVVDARGPELDQGTLLRYLNETMWFPAAAISPYIIWQGIDATSAKATMSYGDITASATFIFNEQGDLIDMTAERYHDASGSYQPWTTPISEYGEFGGIRVPVAGEGVWKLSSGDFAYIRPRVTAIEVNRPERW